MTGTRARWSDRANGLLDLAPNETVRVGGRAVPAFRSLGVLGFHLALLTALLTGFVAGVPALDAAAVSAVAGASFFGWGLLRRMVAGHESLVLLEHVWVAFGAVALLRWASGAPVLPGLDVLAVGLCPFLACGRIGCLAAGCCHGWPATVGVVYPPSAGLPERLCGVRLFPAPLVEAVALIGIGAAGFALAGGRPGAATCWVLAAYATVRFGTEALRGDRRPTVLGISVPRLMCGAQFAAAMAIGELIGTGQDPRRVAWEAAALTATCFAGVALAARRRDRLTVPAHLDETWALIRSMTPTAPTPGGRLSTAETSAGMRVAASWGEYGLHVSLSHPVLPADGVLTALGLSLLARTGSAVHSVVPPSRLPERDAKPKADGLANRYHPYGAEGASGSETDGDYFGERSDV